MYINSCPDNRGYKSSQDGISKKQCLISNGLRLLFICDTVTEQWNSRTFSLNNFPEHFPCRHFPRKIPPWTFLWTITPDIPLPVWASWSSHQMGFLFCCHNLYFLHQCSWQRFLLLSALLLKWVLHGSDDALSTCQSSDQKIEDSSPSYVPLHLGQVMW